MTELPAAAKTLLDNGNFVVVGTSNTDGSPQTSVLWATYDGNDVLLSTIQGRKKETNWLKDPRASVLILDRDDPYRYVEVRGSVSMTTEGGPELIERLSQLYTGRATPGTRAPTTSAWSCGSRPPTWWRTDCGVLTAADWPSAY